MFSIKLALTLGCIWTLRKKAAHKDSHFNIPIAIQGLELRFSEHLSILDCNEAHPKAPSARWCPPPTQVFKFNSDAAMRNSFSSIAVMACDATGNIHSAWTNT
jgi:hypothetical protein